MRLVASDLCTKEIAVRLGLSRHTIRNHRCRVLVKLGCRSSAGAVACWLGWRGQK